MHDRTIRPLTVGLVLAAVGLAAACSSHPATSAPPAAISSTVAGAPTVATTEPSSTPSAQQPAGGNRSDAGTDLEAVNCGKVGPTGGAEVDLIADGTAAGTVGCTEAINIISDYYRDAPTMSEGTAHRLVVQGWTCLADTGAFGTGTIGCSKDGFAFHTQP